MQLHPAADGAQRTCPNNHAGQHRDAIFVLFYIMLRVLLYSFTLPLTGRCNLLLRWETSPAQLCDLHADLLLRAQHDLWYVRRFVTVLFDWITRTLHKWQTSEQ